MTMTRQRWFFGQNSSALLLFLGCNVFLRGCELLSELAPAFFFPFPGPKASHRAVGLLGLLIEIPSWTCVDPMTTDC